MFRGAQPDPSDRVSFSNLISINKMEHTDISVITKLTLKTDSAVI